MNLHKCLFVNNDCYTALRTIAPSGVMVHSTGANNPYLSRYVQPDDGLLGVNKNGNDWNRSGILKCPHAFIGKLTDGGIATYQVLPWARRGWHCGSGPKGSANNTHISFEICEDGLTDPDYFRAVYQEAVELTAYLCMEFGLDPLADGVVICHAEGRDRGIASNHGDVLHWFSRHGKTMDDFRADVAEEVDKMTEEQIRKIVRSEMEAVENERALQPASTWAKELLAEAKGKGITDGTRPRSYATREEVAVMVRSAVV